MRFPEFKESWVKFKLKDYFEFKNGLNKEKEAFGQGVKIINYMDVNKNRYLYSNNIKGLVNLSKNEVNSFQVMRGDLFFTRTSETSEEIGLTAVLLDKPPVMVFSGFLLRARPNNECLLLPEFCSYSFSNNRIRYEIIKKSSITTRALTSGTLLNEVINYHPIEQEQMKIAKLFFALDKRIDTQNKIIKDIETLKKLICYQLFFNIPNKMQLSKLCSITTGKLDANQMDENGSYPFFTCGKETLKINTYAFDCEAILISGNGDIGHTKYYNGKFNAYQRTYVLYNFKSSPIFIKYAIDHVLPRKIKEEMQSSAMPYIKLSTLANLNIPYPEINIQNKIIDILNVFQKKLDLEISILEKFKEQKKYLLANMFI